MIRIREAVVDRIIEQDEKTALVNVKYGDVLEKAINYTQLSGNVDVGDTVFLNTTANFLNLGTGGYSFIIINQTKGTSIDLATPGEIMKLRYTPYQINCCYPTDLGYIDSIKSFKSLDGMIILTGELHSMLAPIACLLKYCMPDINIAYIMTDGGCLPLDFSYNVKQLKKSGIVTGTISSGNSFGGDFEAVNIYDALIIAHSVLKSDIAIITMGPGILGTGTMYGFTGIEQGYIIDSINTLCGLPIFIPRISFCDSRERHLGVSHHTLTVLSKVAKTKANVVLPILDDKKNKFMIRQIEDVGINSKHSMHFLDGGSVFNAMNYFNIIGSTMGRNMYLDKEFFLACGASARYALGLLL